MVMFWYHNEESTQDPEAVDVPRVYSARMHNLGQQRENTPGRMYVYIGILTRSPPAA